MNEAERKAFARELGEHFRTQTLARIDLVLADHVDVVGQFALEMQRRLDEAEDLLQAIADRRGKSKATKINITRDLTRRIDNYVRTINARTE